MERTARLRSEIVGSSYSSDKNNGTSENNLQVAFLLAANAINNTGGDQLQLLIITSGANVK